MPGATPRGYPFPLGTEIAEGNQNIEDLARAIDADATALQSRLSALGKVYYGQRGNSDQFTGAANVLGWSSRGESQPAGSVWRLRVRLAMHPDQSKINAWAFPTAQQNCTDSFNGSEGPMWIESPAPTSWWVGWIVVVTTTAPFAGGIWFNDGGRNALWWVNRESYWELVRIQ